ncbi:MAG: hypothetical protein ACPG47_02105 [Leucothrix sp.]
MATNSKFKLTTKQVQRILKMPRNMLASWRNGDIKIQGIDHPDYKIRSGRNFFYSEEQINELKARFNVDNFYQAPTVNYDLWTKSLISKHSVSTLLSSAAVKPVKIKQRNCTFTLTMLKQNKDSETHMATIALLKNPTFIVDGAIIVSEDDFPGAQFIVKVV